jgi:integrase
MQHLQRRGGFWYYRCRYPLDLREQLHKSEIKISLRVRRFSTAKRLVKLLDHRAEELFILLRRNWMKLSEARLNKLVADHFRKALDEAEEARLNGANLLRDLDEDGEHGVGDSTTGLELHLEGLVEDLARGDYGSIQHVADAILEGAGVSVPKDTPEYRRVCRESLKAAIGVTRIDLERMHGKYAPILTSAPSSSHVQAEDDGVLLSTMISDHVAEMSGGKRWTKKTLAENESIYRVFLEAVVDRGISTLNHKLLVEFRDTLTRLPSNMNKKPEYRGKTVGELLEMKVKKPLSTNTVNKYLNRVSSLMKWAVQRELIPQNYAEGLSLSKRNAKDSEEREAYSTADLKKMLAAPIYTTKTFPKNHPERYFIPLIAALSGLRLNEICQMDVADIREVDGIPCFDINANGNGKRVKSAAGKRLVPIHPTLIDLGLLKYAEGLKEGKLWPKLKLRRDGWGHGFSRYYQMFNRKYICSSPKRVFHSFRHLVATTLKHNLIDDSVTSEILGHATRGELSRYAKAYRPKVILDALMTLDYSIEEELRKLPRWGKE